MVTGKRPEPSSSSVPRISRRGLLAGAAGGACLLGSFALGRSTAPHQQHTNGVKLDDMRPTNNARLRREDQPDAVFGVQTKEKVVAMTFDDGPDRRYTERVLRLLKTQRAHATFFELGVNALALPELTRAVHDAGHTIGNHTYDHADLELLSVDAVEAEIERGEAALIKAGAPRPTLFRPPKGLTDEVVAIFADAAKYRTIFWDAAVEAFVDHQNIAKGVKMMLDKIRPGDVILAHEGGHVIGVPGRPILSRERTMTALPMLFEGLAERGYRIVDVPRLLRVGPVRQGRNVVGA